MALVIQILVLIFAEVFYILIKTYQMSSQGTLDINRLQSYVIDGQNTQLIMIISILFAIADIIVFGLWLRKLKREEESVIQANKLSGTGILLLIVLGVCLQIGLSGILTLISSLEPGWFKEYGKLMEQLGMGNSLSSFLYVGIAGPIAEELIFRGVTLQKAKRLMPFFAANILQALLFAVYHLNLIQGLYAFAIGLCFGLVRYAFNTLAASITLHMSVNICGIILSCIPTDNILLNPLSGGSIFTVSAIGIFLILKYFIGLSKTVKTEERIYTYDDN